VSEWVIHSSSNLCVEKMNFSKALMLFLLPLASLILIKLQLFQVPLCAISSSYYSCNKVLAVIVACATTCGEREDDATPLI
jgi:hypothetical protein